MGDLESAIRGHMEFRLRLRRMLESGGGPEVHVIADDGHCTLGQWIARQEDRLSGFGCFASMRTIHRHFHARSAELLLAAKAGELATPDDELLARLSNHLVVALQDLKKALSEAV